MEPLVVSVAALGLSLVALCVAILARVRSYTDSDVDELGEQVARLTRRARADTMRRVRQEAGGAAANGEVVADAPPQLRSALPSQAATSDARALKQSLRMKLLN